MERLVLIMMDFPLFIFLVSCLSLFHQQIHLFLMSRIFLLYFILKELLLNKSSLLLSVIRTFIPGVSCLSWICVSGLILLFGVAAVFIQLLGINMSVVPLVIKVLIHVLLFKSVGLV